MMQMRPIDDLLPQVMRLAPSCPELVAIAYLREAAREFCSAIPVWRDIDSFTVSDPDYELLVTIPDAEIIKIEAADLDGVQLEPVSLAVLDEQHPNWFTDEQVGSPRYLTQLGPDSISLYPRAIGKLTMRLRLKPSGDAQTLPDVLIKKYSEVVGRGGAGKVLSMPNVEWSNPSLASVHLGFLARHTNTGAQVRARNGQQGARMRTRASFI